MPSRFWNVLLCLNTEALAITSLVSFSRCYGPLEMPQHETDAELFNHIVRQSVNSCVLGWNDEVLLYIDCRRRFYAIVGRFVEISLVLEFKNI
mgnify:CR=1 FL=1